MKRRRVQPPKLTAVDIFAGAGGLSQGLRQAGLRVAAAVEIESNAVKTYRANHARARVLERDVRDVTGENIIEAAGGVAPDILVGCAPCQGFCSLTRKWKREDPRNILLMEFLRLIDEVQPAAVMMENVPGLLRVGRPIFDRFLNRLDELGYYAKYAVVQMADFGVPQNRRRLVLTAGRGFVIPLPKPTHASEARRSGRSRLRGTSDLPLWRSVRAAIGGFRAPVTWSRAQKHGGATDFNWHVVRDLQPQTKARLKAALPGKTWLAVSEKLRPECHRKGYNGFTNVYQRMTWDRVSPTITTGCITPCKGRFGHPDRRRTTISVREAASLQTFPQEYRFDTEHIDRACDMIGNAVPPLFAQLAGEQIRKSVEAHRRALS